MNNILKALIPVGIGFCLGRTRVLISSLKEKKFEIQLDLSSPVVTKKTASTTIANLDEKIREIEKYYNRCCVDDDGNDIDVEVI